MVAIERSGSRPFGQREYPDLSNFRPTLVGPHYKFTLLLPVIEKLAGQDKEKEVFTTDDLDKLIDLFCKDFGGETSYVEARGPPSIKGYYVGKKGDIVIDWHVQIEVYTKKYEGAVEYFEELKARLLIHAKEIRMAEQDELVIVLTEADFVRNRPLGVIITESEERLKYLKR